jgi:hypothetical protein
MEMVGLPSSRSRRIVQLLTRLLDTARLLDMARGTQVPRIDELIDWSADAFERLNQLRQARELLDIMIEQAVSDCRRNAYSYRGTFETVNGETREVRPPRPFSWTAIGQQLGVSRQAAQQRFSHLG